MGNVIPCGGTASSRRSSLDVPENNKKNKKNNSATTTTSTPAGQEKQIQNCLGTSKWKTAEEKTSLSQSTATTTLGGQPNAAPPPSFVNPWRRSSYISLRGALKTRRPSKLRAVLAVPKCNGPITELHPAQWACERLGMDVSLVTSTTEAVSAWKGENGTFSAQLVIVDVSKKSTDIDIETIGRSIRQSPHGDLVVFVGIVNRSFLESEDLTSLVSLLAAGINRVVPDQNSRSFWLNELIMVLSADLENNLKLQSVDSLFAALDGCSDIVQIADSHDKFVYSNHASQKLLRYTSEELSETNLWDFQSTMGGLSDMVLTEDETGVNTGSEMIRQKLEHGKSWEGSLNCKRKTGDYVPLYTKVIPVKGASKKNLDMVVYIKQPPPLFREKSLSEVYDTMPPMGGPMGGSGLPGHNHGVRRQSIAKIHSMPVETPITKIINIILTAQENSSPYVAQALDKVLEILQSSDSLNFFSPEFEKEKKRRTDAVTSDLLGALLSNSTRDVLMTSQHRRHSSDKGSGDGTFAKIGHSTSTAHRPSFPTLDNTSGQLREILEKSDSWDNFDILQLEKITEKRCLVWLGMTTFLRFEVQKTLKCPESTLQNWLTLIEANYNQKNSYHNSTHASDVLHAIACFLESEKVKEYCDDLDEAACIIAASIHDVNHPGRNSAFLCNSNAELATLYNDITVLENHHAALGFKLSMSDDRVNIFKNLDRDSYKLVRQAIIDMVLATDMSKHFIHVNKFNSIFGRPVKEEDVMSISDGVTITVSPSQISAGSMSGQGGEGEAPEMPPNTAENVAILKRMMIKCADVSNPARPLPLCKEWAYRIAEEYFSQTDDEKKLGMPVVMPQFDRTTCSIPKSQIGFYDFFILDMFEMFNGFADMPLLCQIIRTNYLYWKEENDLEEEKLNTAKKVQTLDEEEEESSDSKTSD